MVCRRGAPHFHGGGVTRASPYLVVLVITTLYFVAELATALYIESLALEADAFHMLGDILSLITGYITSRLSHNRADGTYTFGFSQSEVIGALVNGSLLLGVSLELLSGAMDRFLRLCMAWEEEDETEQRQTMTAMMIFGCVGVVVQLVNLHVFHDHHHHHPTVHPSRSYSGLGEEVDSVSSPLLGTDGWGDTAEGRPCNHTPRGGSATCTHHGGAATSSALNIKAATAHVLGDLVGSLGILVTSLILRYGQSALGPWRLLADPLCSLLIVATILFTTLPIIRQSVSMLLLRVPQGLDLGRLRAQLLLRVPEILEIPHLHLMDLKYAGHDMVVCLCLKISPHGPRPCQVSQAARRAVHAVLGPGVHSIIEVQVTDLTRTGSAIVDEAEGGMRTRGTTTPLNHQNT